MSEKMPRNAHTTAPTSRLMGRGAFYLAGALLLDEEAVDFFAVPEDFFVPPEELAIYLSLPFISSRARARA